jgi:tRNA threonylcarbamoyladenosine biosynthesis protein TsaE
MESFLNGKFRLRKKLASTSPTETAAAAGLFAGMLKEGQITGLLGELGAGKTNFVKGAAKFFGLNPGEIVSPTFNLVKEHKNGHIVLFHFDLYRLKTADELDKIGYRDYITEKNAVTFIEWPDRIKETWKDYDWVVRLVHKGKKERLISIYQRKSKVKSIKYRRNRKTAGSR